MTSEAGELDRANSPHEHGRPIGGRIPQLDGVRALAVLLVLIHHGVAPTLFGGYVGVDVFFVMSGYLITGILLAEVDRRGRIRFRRFYLRRIIRLYPALFVIVAVLFIPGLLLTPNARGYLLNTGAALTYTTPILAQVGRAFGPWRHTWSLGVEEIFYLAWPALLLIGVRWVRSRRALAIVALAIGGAMITVQLVQDPTRALNTYALRGGGLFFGCALALWLHNSNAQPPRWAGIVGLLGVLGSAAAGTFLPLAGWAIALCCVASTLLIAHLATRPTSVLARTFAWRPAAYFGLISYETYLWHYPVLVLGAALVGGAPANVALLALPLSVVLGAVTQAALSRPLDRLKQVVPY